MIYKTLILILLITSCSNYNIHYIETENYNKRIKKVQKQNKKTRKLRKYSQTKTIIKK